MSVTEEQLQRVRSALAEVRVPSPQDTVVNDECVYSFDSPYSEQGLFVNLSTWQGVGADYLPLDLQKHNCHLYLQEIFRFVPKPEVEEAPQAAPTKLAIGMEGGFLPGELKFDTLKEYFVCYVDNSGIVDRIKFPNTDLPEFLSTCCQAITENEGFHKRAQVQAWEDTTERPVSKYADALIQLDNGKKISNDSSKWVCEESGMTENLWLNLSTGHIGSGRRNWDGTGGTGAAVHHFEETGGLYPLVVKLGTITPQGADVWSYAPDEDCLVTDPKLAEHLSHWGISIMSLEKTEKTMAELEIDLNNKYEFGKMIGDVTKLEKRSGPGLVGMTNTGNSCYFNSVLEVLFDLPEFHQRYFEPADRIFQTAPRDVAADFPSQMAKLGVALRTNRYVRPSGSSDADDAEAETLRARNTVAPRMLRHLVGKGHAEFSSNRQQDAMEYFQHFLEFMNRNERTQLERIGGTKPIHTSSLFAFEVEDRIQCTESQTVKYVSHPENVLALSIPLDAADVEELEAKRMKTDNAQDSPRPPPTVPFQDCISTFANTEVIEMFSPAVGHAAHATKCARFKNFPRYLMLQLRRYYVDQNWQPKKIDAQVDVPEHLNLEQYRSTGLQPGETPMPEEAAQPAEGGAQKTADMNVVAQLMGMGFSENAGIRAALATNNDPDAATNWILSHLEDADLNDPVQESTAGGSGDAVDPDALMMLTSMGFTEAQVRGALKATSGNAERAADWLFSHADDLDAAIAALETGAAPSGAPGAGSHELEDGEGRYTLIGFITHMGRNTGHGHYVCYVKKRNEWVMFNDDAVYRSEEPPVSLGYMFLYRRDDAPTDI